MLVDGSDLRQVTRSWMASQLGVVFQDTFLFDAPVAGNVAHGEEIFWGKADCGACHMMRGRGGLIG